MASRKDVELCRVGTFDLSTGPQAFTAEMMRDAAARATAAGTNFRAPLKLGHTDPRNDGEPAFGWLSNLRTTGDGDDTVLLGDIDDMPQWLADTAPSAYPHRSIEGNVHTAADGTTGLELTGLALLGVTPPGIPTLNSWRDLPLALAASSSQLPLVAFAAAYTALTDDPATPTDAPDGAERGTTPATPEPPAEPPAETHPTQEGDDTMSDTITQGLRQRLGITDADLDESGILSALDQALAERATPADPTPEAVAAAVAAAGNTTIPTIALEELRIAAAAGAEARAVQLRAERDETIGAAIRAGRIAPARRDHWVTQWDRDPQGIAAAITELPVLFPVAASGHAGNEDSTTVDALDGINDAEMDRFAASMGLTTEDLR